MAGINNTDVTKRVASVPSGEFDSYDAKETDVVFSGATGAGIQYGTFSIMGLVGFDHLFGAAKNTWAYQHKIWYGFTFGLSLDKLVGLSK